MRRLSTIVTRRAPLAVASTVVLTVAAGALSPAVATSAPTLAVSITQTTGTAPFDADDAAGHDSSLNNDVVRTNDLINYGIEIRYENEDGSTSSENTTFAVDLPQGTQLDSIPPFCDPATSSLTPATIPAPPVPLTMTSWQSLPTQRLICNVGTRSPGSTRSYPLSVRVLAEVPDGTQLDPVAPTATSDEISTPVASSNAVDATVSAAPDWDLSKNSTVTQENSGYFAQSQLACQFDPSQACIVMTHPILLGAPAGGKGTTPLLSPVSFVDDLSPSSLWAGTSAAGISDLATYGARLRSCSTANTNQTPGYRVGAAGGTSVNSVRNSGVITCTQPGGPGTPVTVSIANADTSLFTFPSEMNPPAGTALPSSTAYAISSSIQYEIPVSTIRDFGVLSGGNSTLKTTNVFKNLNARGLDGTTQPADVDPTWNNYRETTPRLSGTSGSFNKVFVGVPGAAGNTSPSDYTPSFAKYEGPPGGLPAQSGQITAAPTQGVISMLSFGGTKFGDPATSFIGCDTWDPTQLQLMAGPVPASTQPGARNFAQAYPSNGAAVWMSGATTPNTGGNPPFDYRVQYSTGGGNAAGSECASGTWYDNPQDVPGNDPALAATGVYSAVSRVRVWVEFPEPGPNGGVSAWVSIHQRVNPDVTTGEILPNFAGDLFSPTGSQSLQQMLDDPRLKWTRSSYNPTQHTGLLGDRLIAAPAFSRIVKWVKAPGDADYSLGAASVPQVTGGQTVQYRLNPSLTSASATRDYATDVTVEDCLPVGQSLSTATPTPGIVSGTTPADAGLTCGAGETYVRWDLGQLVANTPIPPIYYTVVVSPTITAGTYTNTTLVTSGDEDNTNPASVKNRTSTAQVAVIQPAGIQVNKVALTPYVEVNRPTETTTDPLRWRIDLANVNSNATVSNPDVIDVLPRQGLRSSAFNGSLDFVSAQEASGNATDLNLWYTSDPSVALDPTDPANTRGGTTVWCDAQVGGAPVWRAAVGDTASAADCPQSAADVTGVRVRKGDDTTDVPFNSGDVLSVVITMMPTGNVEGDVYNNCVEGRVVGLRSTVGPSCAKEYIVASSIGDTVWLDANRDGIQQPGENGYPGLSVTLEGTDTDGNSVHLTTTTDANGHYLFDNLQSGSYHVTFDPNDLSPLEYFTLQDQGADDAVDSDGDQTTGLTKDYTLGVDADNLTVDQGVVRTNPSIEITKYINGDDANQAPGVLVDAGSTMDVTMLVHNNGDVRLDRVDVTDDTIAAAAISCPKTALDVDESMTCTATYPAPQPGVQHTNVATVVGTPPATPHNSDPSPVTDSDPANAQVAVGSLVLSKSVDDQDPGDSQGDATSYPVTVTCTNSSGTATSYNESLPADGTPVTLDGLGLPTTCTVVETDNDGADSVTYEPVGVDTQGVQLTAPGTEVNVVITNRFEIHPGLPAYDTVVSAKASQIGDEVSDTVTVSGLRSDHSLRMHWQLYGPYKTKAAISCTDATVYKDGYLTLTGNGKVTTPAVKVRAAGWYTYVESNEATKWYQAQRTACGMASETTVVTAAPTVRTVASHQHIDVGDKVHDAVTIRGLPDAQPTKVTAYLYGPAAKPSGISCTGSPVHKVTFTARGDGTYQTPAVKIRQPGWYSWVAKVPRGPLSAAASEGCRQASETVLATRDVPPVPPPVPTGFDGQQTPPPAEPGLPLGWLLLAGLTALAGITIAIRSKEA